MRRIGLIGLVSVAVEPGQAVRTTVVVDETGAAGRGRIGRTPTGRLAVDVTPVDAVRANTPVGVVRDVTPAGAVRANTPVGVCPTS